MRGGYRLALGRTEGGRGAGKVEGRDRVGEGGVQWMRRNRVGDECDTSRDGRDERGAGRKSIGKGRNGSMAYRFRPVVLSLRPFHQ